MLGVSTAGVAILYRLEIKFRAELVDVTAWKYTDIRWGKEQLFLVLLIGLN